MTTQHRESMFDLDLSFLDNHTYDNQLQMDQHNVNHQQNNVPQQQHLQQQFQHAVHQYQPLHQQQQQQIHHNLDFTIPSAASTVNSAALTAAATAAAGAPSTAIDMFNTQFLSLELGEEGGAFDFDFDKMQNNIHFDPHHGPFHHQQLQNEEMKYDDMVHPMTSTTTASTTKKLTKNSTTKPKRQYKKRKSEGDVVGLPQSPKKKGLLAKSNSTMTVLSTDSSSPRSRQTSTFRGVSCCGKDRKFQARIRDANRVRYLGRFATEVEAALVYDASARSLKGPDCPTNFIALSEEQKEELKIAFVQNGYRIPESMSQWVRGKSKAGKRSPKRSSSTPTTKKDASKNFPDSPIAKVRTTAQAPMISPKSTSKRASPLANDAKTFLKNKDNKQQSQQQLPSNTAQIAISF